MKRLLAIFLVALFSLTSAAISIAADNPALVAEAPILAKGESWTQGTGATETFLREEGGMLVFFREDKKFTGERYRTKDLNLVYDMEDGAQVNTRRPHFGLLAFPLTIGKKWGHSYQNKGTWRQNWYEVVSFEKIETKAGTFDAFRIEGLDKRSDRQNGIKVVVWYAPSAKAIVKMTGEDETNHMGVSGWNWELSSYTLFNQSSPLAAKVQ